VITICETFVSVQGEGLTVGTPAFFIRTGKCSVGCRFCDTKYSWSSRERKSVEELVAEAERAGFQTVIVTGGEPLEEEELPHLLTALKRAKPVKQVIVETCGHTFRDDLPRNVRLVLSPKPPSMGVPFPFESVKAFLKHYREVELKFTLFNGEDLKRIKEFIEESEGLLPSPVVFQPLETPLEDYGKTCKRVAQMLLSDGELRKLPFRVIPQVHKLIGLK
jgi:7-carboxy-7-deazaguanine synthase